MNSIILHHDDMDGIASAAILAHEHETFKNAMFLKVNYNDNFDYLMDALKQFQVDAVALVDFSLNAVLMTKLRDTYKKNFIWIDHHKTAKEKLSIYWKDETLPGLRSTSRCGAYLVHQFVKQLNGTFQAEKVPAHIQLVDDYDRWVFKLDDTKAFNMAAHVLIKSPKDYTKTLIDRDGHCALITKGEVLVKAMEARVQRIIKNTLYYNLNVAAVGRAKVKKLAILNCTCDSNEAAEYLYTYEKADIVCIWARLRDSVKLTFRSPENGPDVSKIAKALGGGGHEHAAGVHLSTEQGFFTIAGLAKQIKEAWIKHGN